MDVSFPDVALYSHLVEILIYLTRAHPLRSKSLIIQYDLGKRVAQFLTCPQKHLQLSKLVLCDLLCTSTDDVFQLL